LTAPNWVKITLDAYAASHRAVREMKEAGELSKIVRVRSSQYLNNLIEQGHRRVKRRIRPMPGFKRFDHAAATISGIELAEKIKKGQFKIGKLRIRKATMSELWSAALAALPHRGRPSAWRRRACEPAKKLDRQSRSFRLDKCRLSSYSTRIDAVSL
jgi:hypothetical protein